MVVAFRRHTLLPLEDCLYGQALRFASKTTVSAPLLPVRGKVSGAATTGSGSAGHRHWSQQTTSTTRPAGP